MIKIINKKDEQKASNEWKTEQGTCKLYIRVEGEIDLKDISAQWKGLMSAVGYSMGDFQ